MYEINRLVWNGLLKKKIGDIPCCAKLLKDPKSKNLTLNCCLITWHMAPETFTGTLPVQWAKPFSF